MAGKEEIWTICVKMRSFEKCLEKKKKQQKLIQIWKWKVLNSTQNFVTHYLSDFCHNASGWFSELHGGHIFFIVK